MLEPTHGEQLLRVSGALLALDDLRKAIEARRSPRLVSG
jgi:hypothetical protein